ncbi:ER membrane protein complex subunit 1 [Echinococcus granulosus]|nr:ER membrane protein complex subunit 1 [Echinococcus granulosus]
MLVRIITFFVLFYSTLSLHEDQIGKFDWRQQYIGNAEHYAISHRGSKHPFLYLGSESHVLGALDARNGSLVWRQALEEDGRFLSINICEKYLFTLSLRYRPLLRAWSSKTGHLIAEFPFKSDSQNGNLICDEGEGSLFVVLTDKFIKMDVSPPALSSVKALPSDLSQYSNLIASTVQSGVLIAVASASCLPNILSRVVWNMGADEQSELDLSHSLIYAPTDVLLDKCILSKSVLACIGERLNNIPILLSLQFANSSTWNVVDLASHPLSLVEPVDGRIFVKLPTEQVAVFTLEKNTNSLRSAYNVNDVTAFAAHRDQTICLKQSRLKHFNNVQLTVIDAHSGLTVAWDFPEFLNLSRHHGGIKEAAVLPDQKGLLIFTEDHAVQVFSKKGDQLWLREESLAHITSVEMVDLPVSAQEATMQEEFGQSNAGVLELFINRIRSQVHQLSVAFNSWWNRRSMATLDGHGDGFTPLTRDVHNLHKMLLTVTSVGKIFGIESSRGRIVWEYFVPGTRPSNTSVQHLFAQRTTGHFPLTPVACVLLETQEPPTLQSVLLYLDPILGVPLNAQTLKPAATVEDAMVRLPRRIKLAALVPTAALRPLSGSNPTVEGEAEAEATNHVRPLCVVMEDLSVMLLPPALSTINPRNLLPSHGLYIFALNTEPAAVSGYRVMAIAKTTTALTAQPLWHMHLSSEDYPQRILQAAVHPLNEHVYSIGRVLGDRNVLYKYVNPNLLAVMTGGVSNVKSGLPLISLYLIDTVAGQIIHSVVHQRASEPTSLVVSENWVLYSVYNQRSLRTEFTVMELFEPLHTTENLVPSPWDILVHSLVPPSSSAKSDDHNRQFSSLRRAAHSAHGGSDGVLIPDILQRAFILGSPLRSGALAVSLTERGITAKSLLFGLETGNLLELPKSLVDPRRSLDVTPELQEEGLEPYAPELPMSTLAVISYNLTLERIQRIYTAPSGLESTSLVFAHGLDLFFTRIAPSKTYDMLRDDFDYYFISMIVVGMTVASYVTKHFATRRELARAWQ